MPSSSLAQTLTQALIFDMDGTMIDAMPYHITSWAAAICSMHFVAELGSAHAFAAVRNDDELMAQGFLQSLAFAV
jgi:beta-phosphoglucomutase-like phosphatase (HAD superfamily)